MRDMIFHTKGVFYRDTYYVHVSFLVDVRRPYRRVRVYLAYDPLFCEAPDARQVQEMRDALRDQIYRTDEPFVQNCVDRAYPIKNEISIAARGPAGWLGEHHSFIDGTDEVILGEEATDGFFRRPNEAGQYEIVLHVFGVYTPECRYSLEITGEDEP
ncbi:MAG: hypothetical protein IJH78_08280 [Clostridia bacterium]|nr:hypothetical protein [Clostridia bacterium]